MPVRRRSIARRELTSAQQATLLAGGRHWRETFGSMAEFRDALRVHREEIERWALSSRRCTQCHEVTLRDHTGIHCPICGTMPRVQEDEDDD